MQRLVVLISGFGSNLQAIIDACSQGHLPAQVAAVISNRSDAYGLERARQADIPAIVLTKPKGMEREDYDRILAEKVTAFQPDWVILAGWMRILTSAFLERFQDRVVNLHPALPGTFPGTHAIDRAFEAYQRGEIEQTGVMVHLVPDEGVDSGPVLASEVVPIYAQDSLEALEARVHAVEHCLLIDTLRRLVSPESLPRAFFQRPALIVARQLLGMRLVRLENGRRLSGLITEVEAYSGEEDLGCHCRVGRTLRNQVMYGPPGHAYVYFTYGMHWCLNFVVEAEGYPAAVLIRALKPVEGLEIIATRRSGVSAAHWTDGPAKLTRAYNIDRALNGLDLCLPGSPLFVEPGISIPDWQVHTTARIGLNKVPEPWKSIPWRFLIRPGATESLTLG
jgi:formyltetrahydrofolate-dependent phosphoribosylglycinamide formyltransferase